MQGLTLLSYNFIYLQKPKDIARSISKGITAQLDVIGGKIVGL